MSFCRPASRLVVLLILFLCILFIRFSAVAARVLQLKLITVDGNGWQVRGVELELVWHSADKVDIHLSAAHLQLLPPLDHLTSIELTCLYASIQGNGVRCEDGTLKLHSPIFAQRPMQIAFGYQHASREGHFTLTNVGLASGTIDIKGRFDQAHWQLDFSAQTLDVARLPDRLASLSEATFSRLMGLTRRGILHVRAHLSGQDTRLQTAKVNGVVEQLHFSDSEARRVGEHLTLAFEVEATQHDDQWQLHTEFATRDGQLYIEPIFLEVAHHPLTLSLSGSWQPQNGHFDISHFHFDHSRVLHADGQLQLVVQDTVQMTSAQLQIAPTALADLYTTYLQPFLIGTALDMLDTSGQVSLTIEYHHSDAIAATVTLADIALDDQKGRYGLHGLTGTLAWTSEQGPAIPSSLSWREGYIYNLALGASQLAAEARGDSIQLLAKTTIPILDGGLQVDGLRMEQLGTSEPRWEFAGRLTPVSMEAFSQAMGWPTLSGQLSGTIPRVTYVDGTVTVDGSLQMYVFDGEVTVDNLRLERPFSLVPQLYADIELAYLDLERLTGAFSFGKIQGKLSGHIHNLHLQDWQPVAFDASFATPPDDRSTHTISQKAVDNLSSLGGISGALSRSFLRFFDEFSYQRLGISCRLHNDVCEMDGLEPANSGYYIVKGGGLPRINVIGHVRQVDWTELIERLQRATSGTTPVVQ